MPIKLYNTLSSAKEEFIPVEEGKAGIYSCGPTVYWYQHIGNLRTYIFSDILKKTLKYNGYKVKHVMNVTDVGHLTSDADSGEDKMEAAAKKEGRKAGEIADHYLKIFREDLKKLNIEEPDVWCKATEYIKEQIALVKRIEEKGLAYKTSDGVYFDTSKFGGYGAFKRQSTEEMVKGDRVETNEKKNKADFALWKLSEKPGVRQQEWDSPWGTGFPGWHLECSAMSMKHLGESFDIHTGGIDHIPVHHTNEIAQSEAATGKKFVKYWMHGGFLTFKGEKVSKSKGGAVFTVSELEKMNFPPLAYRYLVLTAHYRTQLNFSVEILEGARNSYDRLKNIIPELKDDGKLNDKYLGEFREAVNYDLDMPGALSVLWQMVRDKDAAGKVNTVKEMDKVFCLDLVKKEEQSLSKEQQDLVNERQKARLAKDWKRADEIRKKLEKQGIILEDGAGGVKVTKKQS